MGERRKERGREGRKKDDEVEEKEEGKNEKK